MYIEWSFLGFNQFLISEYILCWLIQNSQNPDKNSRLRFFLLFFRSVFLRCVFLSIFSGIETSRINPFLRWCNGSSVLCQFNDGGSRRFPAAAAGFLHRSRLWGGGGCLIEPRLLHGLELIRIRIKPWRKTGSETKINRTRVQSTKKKHPDTISLTSFFFLSV